MSGIIIIGERLNSSNKAVKKLFENRDEAALLKMAGEQCECGASIIDLNASMLMDGEKDALMWGGECIMRELDVRLSIDSSNTDILLSVGSHFGEDAVLNSLTSDEDLLAESIPVIADSGASVVVMLKSMDGVPATVKGRLKLAERVALSISTSGIMPEKVFLDPVLSPLATSPGGLNVTLETISELKRHYPDFKRIGGLSNISYGLPLRKLLNRTFLSMGISHGLCAVICNPMDTKLMATIKASEAISGLDPGCKNFLKFYRTEIRKS